MVAEFEAGGLYIFSTYLGGVTVFGFVARLVCKDV